MARAWLVVVVACASPGNGPSPAQFATTATGPDGTITLSMGALVPGPPAYAMTFPPAGVRLPSSLTFGSDELLTGSADPCTQIEAGLGVGVTQVVRASAGAFGGATGGSGGDVSVTMTGPTVAQVRVEWDAPYTCAAAHHLHGVTTFTAFPGGRIVRDEQGIVPSDEGLAGTDTCMCGSPNTMTFESFYQFAPGSDVDATGTGLDGAGAGVQQGCTVYGDHAVGVAWPDNETIVPALSTWTHFWQQNATELGSAPQQLTSAIQLSTSTTCSDVLDGLADPDLMIDGSDVPSDNDGIYTDTNPHPSGFDITPVGGDVPASFAVIVDIGDHADITRDPPAAEADFFSVQQLAGDSALLLWFRDGLGSGEKIHIEPK